MLDRRHGQRSRDHHGNGKKTARAVSCAIEPLEARCMLTLVGLTGDLTQSANATTVANMIKGWNPDYIVSVGDNYYAADGVIDNTIGQYYHDYVSPYAGAYGAGSTTGNRFWSAVGNHEYEHSSGAANYYSFFTFPNNERYYKTTQGNVDWFFVNSNPEEPDGNTVGSVQYNWLQSQMAASTATFKFVVFHHPAYSSADSSEATNMQWPFATWGASAVFSGHHHIYERLSVGGIPYFINGLGGASIQGFGAIDPNSQARYESQHGAMLLDIQPASVNFKFFNRTGVQIDTFTITASVTGPAAPSQLIAGAVSETQINLSWADNSTTETNFILERSPDGVSNWAQIATPAANATSYSDASASLLPGVTYHYRVRAAGSGQSANSNTASAATLQPGYVNWIPRGATWKYLDSGVDQGAAWRDIAFTDTTWLGGRGQFGYGDGDENTVVSFGPNASDKYITTYFRKSFTVADPSRVFQLDLSMLRDDGAVVYLNGVEVWRDNMPGGAVSFGTLAASEIVGVAETTWLGLSIDPALLVAGANVLAVEIHQDSGASADLSFDFTLAARLAPALAPPSAFRATAAAYNLVNCRWIDNVVGEDGFKIERSTDGINFTQVGTAAAGATTWADTTVASNQQYWYRVRSYNATENSLTGGAATVTTPWLAPWSNGDIGAVAATGSATYNSGVYTVKGSGLDIGGTADELHYVSQPWSGNGTIIARVNSITNTNAGAKAGIMFRETLATGAKEVSVSLTPAGTIVVLGRGTTGGSTSGPPAVTGITTPIWLKLVRNVNLFTAQYSTNGTTWTTIPGASFTMTAGVFVGLCVTSKNDGVIATGTFDNVSVSASTALRAEVAQPPTVKIKDIPPGHTKWKKEVLDLLA
ncbi:MAG: hypothetical protein QOE14_2643 [Humisphaera sp.]|nr:hypothetical protein [Humisphaera sp.]